MKDKIGVSETVLGFDKMLGVPLNEISNLIKLLEILNGKEEKDYIFIRGKGSKVTKIITVHETFVVSTRFLETVRMIKDFS